MAIAVIAGRVNVCDSVLFLNDRSPHAACITRAAVARKSKTRVAHRTPGSPFLTRVSLNESRIQAGVHPFTIPLLEQGLDVTLRAPVTFLVGENGSGKSTLLEGLAWALGFNVQGGNRDNSYAEGAVPRYPQRAGR